MITRESHQPVSIGTTRTASLGLTGGMTRAELYCWALLVLACAYWGNIVRASDAAGTLNGSNYLLNLLSSVLQNGAFCAAAWLMMAVWTYTATSNSKASVKEISITICICLLSSIPYMLATVLALCTFGAHLLRNLDDRRISGIAALLFALALDMASASRIAEPWHGAVALVDAQVVVALLRVFMDSAYAQGNIVYGAPDGDAIAILSRCASSYPLAAVCLAFVVVSLYQGQPLRRHTMPWIAASLAASVALSEGRLLWMAARSTDFAWLHDGFGRTLYTLAASILALSFPLAAARGAETDGAR